MNNYVQQVGNTFSFLTFENRDGGERTKYANTYFI